MSKSYTCQNPSNTDYTAIITLSVIIIISSRTASYSWRGNIFVSRTTIRQVS